MGATPFSPTLACNTSSLCYPPELRAATLAIRWLRRATNRGSVMVVTLAEPDPAAVHQINEPVGLVDAAGPGARAEILERRRFAGATKGVAPLGSALPDRPARWAATCRVDTAGGFAESGAVNQTYGTTSAKAEAEWPSRNARQPAGRGDSQAGQQADGGGAAGAFSAGDGADL